MTLSIKKLTLILFIIASNGYAQEVSYKKLDAFFDKLDKHNKLMGTMSIAKGNNIVYSRAIGFANIQNGNSNTSTTKFRIGSITKTFTAVIIFQMIEEGKLRLETPLADYYPKLPNASKITIANLLNHSSGLFNITNAKDFRKWMLKPTSKNQMLSRILEYEAQFKPGEKNQYSNTNFILLGYIAETIDKQTYGQILQKRITSKIGLKDTYAGKKINTVNNECLSYSLENDIWKQADETNMSHPAGAGAIVSTANDLTKFFTELFNNTLISKKSLKIMKTAKQDYGHGLFTQELNGRRMYGHNGGIDGFKSFAIYIPEEKLSLAITANGTNFGLMPILISAIASVSGEDFEIPTFSKIELTASEAKQYIGEYTSDRVPFKIIIKVNNNVVFIELPDQKLTKELTPTKRDCFTIEAIGVVLEFDLKSNRLYFKEAGAETLIFKKQ